MNQWRCQDCENVAPEDELLTAPSPFDPADTITGCPNCKSITGFDLLCDEPGCAQRAGCGWPALGGYRHTCGEHYERAGT